MKRIKLGNTSLEVSNLCLGAGNYGNTLSYKEASRQLDAFVGAGGNFIDTANVYCRWVDGLGNCSEELLGRWIRSCGKEVVIATKGGHYDLASPEISRVNRREVGKDLEESLKTLGLNHIDLYWLHRDDESRPVEEIIDFMEDFVKAGKIRYYGASNYKLERLEAAVKYAAAKGCLGFSAVSNRWSLADVNPDAYGDPSLVTMTEELCAWHEETGMPAVPYSASAQGFFEKLNALRPNVKDGVLLTPYKGLGLPDSMKAAYINERSLKSYEALLRIQREHPYSLYSLSVAYLTHKPFPVIPVSSVSNMRQLDEFIASGDIELDKLKNMV